ncbi:MAG: signal recognition particle-docking protein FtsY [Nanoarchaeota archaeon]|nr:signal recognition particle-docking protein FtsY [Nanoarchaeota archaeon]MBU2441938.1 signal recognition particle-docking protein FtsY [Nanoarchaeota archaeon]
MEKEKEEKKEKEKPKQSFFKKLFGKKEQPQAEEKKPELEKEVKVEPKEEIKEEKKEPETVVETSVEEEPEKKGFFKKIKETFTTVKLSEEKFEKLFWELELVLLENNVAVEVIDKIKADLKEDLTTGKVSRKNLYDLIEDSLRESVQSLFMESHFNLVEEIKKKKAKPYIITFIGVNGSGKTTNMAKVAHLLQKNNLKVVFAASDTFRAAAIQQLEEHANNLGIKMIKHDYESDPAAVAFDAIEHAKAKGIDVVMIDTAGRLHSNDNLMNELKKLIRVNKPDLNIFVGESITGNDCVEQAKLFDEAVGIDAIILAKADVDEKGGAAVSVSYVTKKPIIFLGTGQTYDDLTPFKPEIIIKNIGL